MTIEITEFANVSISVSPVGVASGNFGILGFLTKDTDSFKTGRQLTTVERHRSYTSLASVGEDWNTSSAVFVAATAFYGQTPTPNDFTVMVAFSSAAAGSLLGGGHDSLVDLQGITAGELDIIVDGAPVAITALDFSSATSYEDVATVLSAAVTGGSCYYNGSSFVVLSGSTGTASSVTFASGTTAVSLGLTNEQGAVSAGVDAETPVAALAASIEAGAEIVGLVTHKDYRDVLSGATGETTLEIAKWAAASKYIFCNTSNNSGVLSAAIASDIISVLKNNTVSGCLSTYSSKPSQYPSAAVFGRAASVNFSAVNSTITLNLKQLSGVAAENLTPTQFKSLRDKFGSAVVQIGKTVNAFTDSRLANGSWLDSAHGLLWLENRCEVDMFNLMYQSPTKVPFTQAGINTVTSTLGS
jgi:hypothetical protein